MYFIVRERVWQKYFPTLKFLIKVTSVDYIMQKLLQIN